MPQIGLTTYIYYSSPKGTQRRFSLLNDHSGISRFIVILVLFYNIHCLRDVFMVPEEIFFYLGQGKNKNTRHKVWQLQINIDFILVNIQFVLEFEGTFCHIDR